MSESTATLTVNATPRMPLSKRLVLATILAPIAVVSLLVYLLTPQNPVGRRRVEVGWNLFLLACWLSAFGYWFFLQRGFGIAAIIMLFTLQICDTVPVLLPRPPRRITHFAILAGGWVIAILQLQYRYDPTGVRGNSALILFVFMMIIYAEGTWVILRRKSDPFTELDDGNGSGQRSEPSPGP